MILFGNINKGLKSTAPPPELSWSMSGKRMSSALAILVQRTAYPDGGEPG